MDFSLSGNNRNHLVHHMTAAAQRASVALMVYLLTVCNDCMERAVVLVALCYSCCGCRLCFHDLCLKGGSGGEEREAL